MNPTTSSFKKRPRVKPVLPEECLACGSENGAVTKEVTAPIETKGESFQITFECRECPACGHRSLSHAQMTQRICRVVRAYQQAHDLLTAEDLVRRRRQAGCATQQDFVDATKGIVASATLKRIEAGQHIQDVGTDIILRHAFELVERNYDLEQISQLSRMPLRQVAPLNSSTSPLASLATSIPFQLAACVTILASACLGRPDTDSKAPTTIIESRVC